MKKIFGILIAFTLFLAGCSNSSESTSATPQNTKNITANTPLPTPSIYLKIDTSKMLFEKGYYDYSGTINNKYKIQMSIFPLNNELVGTYYYESQKIDLELKGKADEKNVILYEYDETGNNTGVFQGTMKTVDSISGTWTSADGQATYPFSLTLKSIIPGVEYGKRYMTAISTKSDKDIEDFAARIQTYIKSSDKENLSQLISYPLTVKIDGKKTQIANKEDFVSNYDKIITSKLKNAIISTYPANMFANYQGVLFGSGSYNIWINENSKSDLTIISINN